MGSRGEETYSAPKEEEEEEEEEGGGGENSVMRPG